MREEHKYSRIHNTIIIDRAEGPFVFGTSFYKAFTHNNLVPIDRTVKLIDVFTSAS